MIRWEQTPRSLKPREPAPKSRRRPLSPGEEQELVTCSSWYQHGQGLFCLPSECEVLAFLTHPNLHFLLPPPGSCLDSSWQRRIRILACCHGKNGKITWEFIKKKKKGRKERKEEGRIGKKKKIGQAGFFFFKCYETERKTVPPLNIST